MKLIKFEKGYDKVPNYIVLILKLKYDFHIITVFNFKGPIGLIITIGC